MPPLHPQCRCSGEIFSETKREKTVIQTRYRPGCHTCRGDKRTRRILGKGMPADFFWLKKKSVLKKLIYQLVA